MICRILRLVISLSIQVLTVVYFDPPSFASFTIVFLAGVLSGSLLYDVQKEFKEIKESRKIRKMMEPLKREAEAFKKEMEKAKKAMENARIRRSLGKEESFSGMDKVGGSSS